MICPDCGLAQHSATGCASKLQAALYKKELVIEQCRKALKEAAEAIERHGRWGYSATMASFVLTQIQQALDSAEGE